MQNITGSIQPIAERDKVHTFLKGLKVNIIVWLKFKLTSYNAKGTSS